MAMYQRLKETICGGILCYRRGIYLFLVFNLALAALKTPAQSLVSNRPDSDPDIDYGSDQGVAIEAGPNKTNLAKLTSAEEVLRLKPEEAEQGYPAEIHGVVTCVVPEHDAFIVQDKTHAIFVANDAGQALPQPGVLLDLQGKTDKGTFAPLIRASRFTALGFGTLPEPVQPTWDQLMNGSLDDQYVEVRGIVEDAIPQPAGYPPTWSKLILRTTEGALWLDVRQVGTNCRPLKNYEDAVVRVRGSLFVALTLDTHQLDLGHVRMLVNSITVDVPAPSDDFFAPQKRAADLTRFDPQANSFQRVKITGQVLYMIGQDYYMMDGTNGVRFTLREPAQLHTGDLVDVVGYPELDGAAPHLRSAVARKIGHASLPQPRNLLPDDLPNAIYDSTLVRITGVLVSSRVSATNETLEIQSGSWRFVARVKLKRSAPPPIGSRLILTGTYAAQGGRPAMSGNVAPFDLLLHSAEDIRVLSRPSWWTLPRLLAVMGILVCALALLALWVTQLRRLVEERTAELATQIHGRERLEHQRAMEQERARIAHDLHDELGSGLTEITMLATVAGTSPAGGGGAPEPWNEIGNRARHMVSTLDEIVWAMNPKHDSLKSLVSYSCLFADRLLKLARISCQLKGSMDLPDRPMPSVRRHEFFLAFKEAITNVIRHSGASEVRLGARVLGERLRLSIADNGRGLDDGAEARGGDGLINMRARLEKMGGRFEIASRKGRGTTVRFYLPLD